MHIFVCLGNFQQSKKQNQIEKRKSNKARFPAFLTSDLVLVTGSLYHMHQSLLSQTFSHSGGGRGHRSLRKSLYPSLALSVLSLSLKPLPFVACFSHLSLVASCSLASLSSILSRIDLGVSIYMLAFPFQSAQPFLFCTLS